MAHFFWLLFFVPRLYAASYSIIDKGDFAPTGQRVEFADLYHWKNYEVQFDFGLDLNQRVLSGDSKLKLRIVKIDGKTWTYTCKAKGKQPLVANTNFIIGKGVSVVAQCRIPENEFAKAVDLHADDVGLPTFVFQVMVEDGQAVSGAQRGFYFNPGGQIESS